MVFPIFHDPKLMPKGHIFLKTIIPSRKATKQYLGEDQ
jgi:hypothetical protein